MILHTARVILWLAILSILNAGSLCHADMSGNPNLGTQSDPTGGMGLDIILSVNLPEGSVFSCAVVNSAWDYAYFGARHAPSIIMKVRLSDLSVVKQLTLNTGEDFVSCAAIDSKNGFAYFGTNTDPGMIVKVRLSDLTRVGSLKLNSGESYVSCAVVDQTHGYAYFGLSCNPGKIVKVRLSDFSRVSTMTLDSDMNGVSTANIDSVGNFAYFCTSEPGTYTASIIKIRLTDFTRAGTLKLPGAPLMATIGAAVIDPRNEFGFFGAGDTSHMGDSGTGHIVKVRLSDLTNVANLAIPDTDGFPAATMDRTGEFAYFVSNGTYFARSRTPGNVVKIRLSDLANIGQLNWYTMFGSSIAIPGVFLDPDGNHLFGAMEAPSLCALHVTYANAIHANTITMTERGTVKDVRFHTIAPGTHVRLAIYDGETPKNLLWQSTPYPASANSWVVAPISSGSPSSLVLDPGSYWLAWQTDAVGLMPDFTLAAPKTTFTFRSTYGPFPVQIHEPAENKPTGLWSLYLTYNPNAALFWSAYK